MNVAEALLDAFVNANILFCIGLALWFALRAAIAGSRLRHAYGTQLRLLNAVFLAIVFGPLLAFGFAALQGWGVAADLKLNLSDRVVAFYLNGGFEMNSSDFERLVLLRDTLTLDVLTGRGWLAQAIVAVFLAGLIVGLTRLGYSMICLRRIVSTSYEWRRIGRISLHLSDRTLVPFSTRGWWRYYVVIPSHMLTEGEALKVSLAHEFQHIRQGDLEWEVVLEAFKPFFFLNPAYHIWKRQVEHLRELSCDNRVLSLGRIDVAAYCETLLSVCQKTLRRDRAFVIAVPKVTLVTADRSMAREGRRSFLEHRIVTVLNAPRLRRERMVFAAMAVPLLFAVAVTTLAIQPPGDWSHDRLMLSTVVNLERIHAINGRY